MLAALTVSVSIARPPDDVYAFLSDPPNWPAWSDFVAKIGPSNGEWLAETPVGRMRLVFVEKNPYRVLDHTATLEGGQQISMPMRVLANQGGSEVLFTIFRQPGMTDEEFRSDVRMIEGELLSLKRLLEREPGGAG